jgi:hypothetical protein
VGQHAAWLVEESDDLEQDRVSPALLLADGEEIGHRASAPVPTYGGADLAFEVLDRISQHGPPAATTLTRP